MKLISREEGLDILSNRVPEDNKKHGMEIFAMYSSVLGGVVTDPLLFVVPIDDHIVTRGHAVFDTCNIKAGQVYGIDFHLDRFLRSASTAKIDLSQASYMNGEEDPSKQKDILKNIILDTVAASGKRDNAYCRYWLSAGRGNFSITPRGLDEKATLYVAVHHDGRCPPPTGLTTEECLVSVPTKSPFLATFKSTNYLVNALSAMEAQSKSGYPGSLGLQIDETGKVAEFGIASIGIVGDDEILRTPKQERILASTTLNRAMKLAEEILVPRGILKGVAFCDVTLEEVKAANEMVAFGGGHLSTVLKFDGKPVGGGKPGKVALALGELIENEHTNSEFALPVPYEKFE
mmetsp:Transcript_13886/g.22669  ORF Transcript_13886/g.22669 Transcript_13886/m.22669 type:complete len:347 (+) Transcript_13886:120-1160(+)